MAVDVLVVVAHGKVAQLPVEALVAGVVLARGAPAVAAPVAEGFRAGLQDRLRGDVHRSALAQGHVVWRIEALGGKVAEGACPFAVVLRAQRVAVVFDQPEAPLVAEAFDFPEVEGISQRVGEEDCFGLARDIGRFQLVGSGVGSQGIHVNKDRHAAVLDDGRRRGGKSRGGGDDLVAGTDAPLLELVGREGRKSDQVCGRARVDQEAIPDAEELREFPLERGAFRSQRKPEVEHARDARLDLLGAIDACGVGNHRLARGEGLLPLAQGDQLAGLLQDLLAQLFDAIVHVLFSTAQGSSWLRASLQ